MTSKATLKARYIANLQATYPFYVEGSRPLQLANEAADAALAGTLKLKGECWDKALKECGLPKGITLKALAGLEAGQ
jgi:hypothetical protein